MQLVIKKISSFSEPTTIPRAIFVCYRGRVDDIYKAINSKALYTGKEENNEKCNNVEKQTIKNEPVEEN